MQPPPVAAKQQVQPVNVPEEPPPILPEAPQAILLENVPEPETFGTNVQFVRNPLEAGRIAGDQRKLTFLLHVSGNFEDDRFT
jgi:hypothetical protein